MFEFGSWSETMFSYVFFQKLLAKSPRNGEFFRSWLLRWYPVVDRHAAIESLQAAVRKGMSQVGFPHSFFVGNCEDYKMQMNTHPVFQAHSDKPKKFEGHIHKSLGLHVIWRLFLIDV